MWLTVEAEAEPAYFKGGSLRGPVDERKEKIAQCWRGVFVAHAG
jgi:hypothetical protein